MKPFLTVEQGAALLAQGKIIGYPTEAVFGLGCAPDSESALVQLYNIKNRPLQKGFILIASDIEQLNNYIDIQDVPLSRWEVITENWPGPYTWVFKAKPLCSKYILGPDHTIAVRVTNHPQASQLCALLGKPIISTSANKSGMPPLKEGISVLEQFGDIAGVVEGCVGGLLKPTTVQNAMTGEILR